MLGLQRAIMQNSNDTQSDVWTGYKQQANFYSLLQNQVQFGGDQNLAAGDVSAPRWNGMRVSAFADVLDTDWFMLTLSDLLRVTGGRRDVRSGRRTSRARAALCAGSRASRRSSTASSTRSSWAPSGATRRPLRWPSSSPTTKHP